MHRAREDLRRQRILFFDAAKTIPNLLLEERIFLCRTKRGPTLGVDTHHYHARFTQFPQQSVLRSVLESATPEYCEYLH